VGGGIAAGIIVLAALVGIISILVALVSHRTKKPAKIIEDYDIVKENNIYEKCMSCMLYNVYIIPCHAITMLSTPCNSGITAESL